MKKAKGKITVLFEFSQSGNLKSVLLNAETEHDEAVLQRGLSGLLQPEKMTLLKRLFMFMRSKNAD